MGRLLQRPATVIRIAAGLLLAVLSASGQGGMRFEVVPVCALFRDPAIWNGRYVSVAGELLLSKGGEDGPLLSATWCKDAVIIKKHRFPNTIYLSNPRSRTRIHKVDFDLDETSQQLLNAMESQASSNRGSIRVIVEGLFETRSPLETLVREQAPYPWSGFGHMGSHPAQILLRSIRLSNTNGVRP